MKRLSIAGGLAAACLPSAAIAAAVPAINVGNHVLIPNQPGQIVQIPVTGGQQVSGVDFNSEIADGGVASGGTAGPAFQQIDLISGTIFATNNTGQQIISSQPQVYAAGVITQPGPAGTTTTVPATGLLATVTLDTTGFSTPGSVYSLKLANFHNGAVSGDTDFAADMNADAIVPTVTNGNLIITYPGDTNLDGTVGLADLLTLAHHYGQSGATWGTGDLNGDGVVNFADLMILAHNYGNSVNTNVAPPATVTALAAVSPAIAIVPEPSTLAAVAVPFGSLLLRRRRG